MAAAKPRNVVIPRDLSQPSTSSTMSKARVNIDDNTKRQVAVGIGLNDVLVPELRKYLDYQLEKFYKVLVNTHKINSNQNSRYKPERYGFSYKKSRIGETPNLWKDADCSTNTMRGLGSDDVTGFGQRVS